MYKYYNKYKAELYTDQVKSRIVELRAKGDSFQTIANKIKTEFNFPFKFDKASVWRVYNATMKDAMVGDKSEIIEGGKSKAMEQRDEVFQQIRSQLIKINTILWKHINHLEEAQDILRIELKKWLEQAKGAEEIDKDLIFHIENALSRDVGNISVISTQLMKQLETQARLVGLLTKPAEIRVSRLDVINQINQSFKTVQNQGYFMTKLLDSKSKRKFNLNFENQSAEEVFNELVRIGMLKQY